MKSITSLEKTGYVIIDNPDLITDYKFSTVNYTIGSGERALYFGELQIYNTLRVEGELDVLYGNIYTYNLNTNVTSNVSLYGLVNITDTVDLTAELTIL